MVLIIHIIFEDTTSAFSFWSKWAYLYLKDFEMYKDACGNLGLRREFKRAIQNAKSGDTIFIVFDNVICSSFNYKMFLQLCEERCKERDLQLRYTAYYCFEELFLSSSILMRMINDDALQCINECINNSSDYMMSETIIELCNNLSIPYNREKVANVLLSKLTQTIKGDFQIIKKPSCFESVGKCWICDCNDVKTIWDNDFKTNNICSNCAYKFYCVTEDSKFKQIINSSRLNNDWIISQMNNYNHYQVSCANAFSNI